MTNSPTVLILTEEVGRKAIKDLAVETRKMMTTMAVAARESGNVGATGVMEGMVGNLPADF